MSPIAQHVTCRLRDDRVIAPSPEARLIAARTVLRVARPFGLVGFSLVDTHLHQLTLTSRGAELGRRVEIALHRALGLQVGFEPARPRDIDDQWHLQRSLVYLVRQQLKHKVALDLFHEGSNVPDLLGLRVTGAYTRQNLRRFLPRLAGDGLRQAVAKAGAPGDRVDLPRIELASGPLDLVAGAAAAAIGRPALLGKESEVVAARVAAIKIIDRRLSLDQIARQLGVSRATVARLRRLPADVELVRAIHLQLGLRDLMLAQGLTRPRGVMRASF